ncbi:Serine protease gd N-terminus [Popillia japonica]|uniref:Serine protease gd N-terminus n=1 Tax=Popillia japonica TaxID=7064 RepID=A0AAW1MZL0_POPJA
MKSELEISKVEKIQHLPPSLFQHSFLVLFSCIREDCFVRKSMATRFVFLVCFTFVWFGIQTNAQDWTSPCPDIFKYHVERNRWYGTITFLSDVDLEGIWVRVLFDGPVEQLTAEFQEYGEVSGKENEFVIKDPHRKLKANTKLDVDFNIQFNDQIQTPKLLEIYRNSHCGISETVSSAPLIVGGWDSIEGEWPWHSAIYKNDAGTWKYYCGGTIIAPRFILTAGHCVVDLSTGYTEPAINFLVYVGTTNLKKLPLTTKTAQVEKIHTHSKFSKHNLHNDIALLELWRPLDYDVYIKPVCLWQGSTNLADIVDQLGTVVGWGKDETIDVSPTLKQARMPVVAYDVCLLSKPQFFTTFLNPNSYCAGFRNGSSVCNGDSGSGMVIERTDGSGEKSWHLRGVVSVSIPKPGTKICNPMEYMVFTDVAKYLTWIKQIMNEDPVTTVLKPTTFMTANKTECGLKTQLVDNGKKAEEYWPWHIAIMSLRQNKFEYRCGGTLVSSKLVLTAAHCVTVLGTKKMMDKDLFLLHVGLTHISEPGPYSKLRLVKDIIIHNDFDPERYFNDLAIVEINEPVEFSDYIKPICLWDGDVEINSLIGQFGTIAGWGLDNSNVPAKDLLDVIKIPIVGLETCLFDNPKFFSQFTSPKTFCAGGPNGSAACTAYSGRGIIFPRKNTQINKDIWYIRGITSVTPRDAESGCNTKNYVVFTDVAKHLAWIKENSGLQ